MWYERLQVFLFLSHGDQTELCCCIGRIWGKPRQLWQSCTAAWATSDARLRPAKPWCRCDSALSSQAKGVFWLNICVDTQVEYSPSQEIVPKQEARGAHRLELLPQTNRVRSSM